MKKMAWLAVLPLLLSAAESPGRTPEPNRTPEALPLYPKGAPESNGLSADSVKVLPDVIFGAVDADNLMLPADPTQATGQAVVICPGGGYGAICFDHEGLQVARWFNTQGVTAIVLRYRMPNGHPEIPLKDAQQMLELVRKQAPKWRVDPHRVGIIGFSAGGHLAAAASTLFTGADNRPDFTILCYAATSDDPDIIDKETFGNLIGPDASAPETFRYSCEKQVTDRTPQAFIALSDDDDNVLPGNSTRYYTALKSRNVPTELHIFPTGGHGWGWSESFRYKDELRAALGRWLEEIRK